LWSVFRWPGSNIGGNTKYPEVRVEVHTGFHCGNLREEDHLEDPGVDGRIILKYILEKWDGAQTGLVWLRIGTGGELL
jgi:hypothetical protein